MDLDQGAWIVTLLPEVTVALRGMGMERMILVAGGSVEG